LPSKSDWYRKHFSEIPNIVACPNLNYLDRAIEHNLREIFSSSISPVRHAWCIMVDEIAIDPCVLPQKFAIEPDSGGSD
jgi:hypothetical protein